MAVMGCACEWHCEAFRPEHSPLHDCDRAAALAQQGPRCHPMSPFIGGCDNTAGSSSECAEFPNVLRMSSGVPECPECPLNVPLLKEFTGQVE